MKIALVGCGAAAERYYIPALRNHPDILKKLYVVDRDRSRAQNTVDQLGGGELVEDYKSILGEVQGAIIALPNMLHHAVGLDFLRSKAHVLCEKPLADSHEQALEMVASAKENGVILSVNNSRRMFPVNQAIQKIISQKQLGEVKSVHYTEGSMFGWASATGFYVNPKATSKGLLSDLGPHVIDILCWWLGGKPEVLQFNDDSFGGPESVARVRAEFGGARIDIFLNRLVDLDSSFEIQCENGTISGKPMDWGRYTIRTAGSREKEIKIPCSQKNYPAFIIPVVDNFIKTVQGEEKPLVSGSDVLPSLAFIDQCYEKRKRFAMPWYDRIQVGETPGNNTVLVTGATGFIGASIVERLHLSKEKRVKAVVHNWANAARLGRFPVEIVQMDLMNEKSIDQALNGVHAVIHCAKGPHDVTVRGTENLLKSSLKKGIGRFIHLSTTEIYGNKEGDITEASPFEYTGNEYNRMKVDAEKVCWQYVEKGLHATILRPSIVYGPFSKNWTLNFAKLLKNRNIGIFEGIGEGFCNLIYVQDLVDAALICIDNDKCVGEAFNINGPQIFSWNQYFKLFNDALGLSPIKIIKKAKASFIATALSPVRKLGGFARDHFMDTIKKVANFSEAADSVLRYVEKTLKSNLASDELKLFSKQATYVTQKAEHVLGFKPNTAVQEGVQNSVTWLRHNSIIGNG